jgi:MinD-like ATPase involved in chromosome partitioning or flagellar assembly
MSARPSAPARSDIRARAVVDGRPVGGAIGRVRALAQRTFVTAGEREEADLERRIRALADVRRPNLIAALSPRGGPGKTTGTLVVGTLLATHRKLRVIAVDAAGAFGTLGRLAPESRRCERSLADLLHDADRLHTAAEVRRYVTPLASGLHVLASPQGADATCGRLPDGYGELVAFLSCFYEVVLLDLGPGLLGPVARLAIERADQLLLAATPEWLSTPTMLTAFGELPVERTIVMVNKSRLRPADARTVEQHVRAKHARRAVTVPFDEQLAAMLDTGTYGLEALTRRSRVAIKRLGLAVAERLV